MDSDGRLKGWYMRKTVRKPAEADTAEALVAVFNAVLAETPPLDQPVQLPLARCRQTRAERRSQRSLDAYDAEVYEASLAFAVSFGLDPEEAEVLADEHLARLRRVWSATINTLDVVTS